MSKNMEDDFNEIKSLLKKGTHTISNPDFEESVMSRIYAEENYQIRINRLIRKAFICFILGILLIAFLFIWLLLSGNSYQLLSLLSLFFLGVVGLLLGDNFLKLLRQYDLKRISKRAIFKKQTTF